MTLVTASTRVFFVANFRTVATKETSANYANLAVLGEKKKQKSPYLEEKISHMEPFRQMSYYWSPELGRILKRFCFTV
jgi:hypothetical protein